MNRLVRLFLLLAALTLLVAVLAAPTSAARAPLFSHPVHRGQDGKAVAAVQWLLSGHDPNHYRKTIHPMRGRRITGQFGKFTAKAVLRARWLLGEPVQHRRSCHCRPAKRAVFDRDLYLILTGQRARPLGWIGKASKRMALADRVKPSRATSSCARAIVRYAESQVGVHEIPWDSNSGPQVRFYQSSTGAYGLAWCDSFVMKDYQLAGAWPYPRYAAVYATVQQGHEHTLLRSTPAAGAAVAYVSYAGRIRINAGHIGIVERVTRDGFYTIEGNSGDAVTRHFRRFGDATVFIYPPCPSITARGPH